MLDAPSLAVCGNRNRLDALAAPDKAAALYYRALVLVNIRRIPITALVNSKPSSLLYLVISFIKLNNARQTVRFRPDSSELSQAPASAGAARQAVAVPSQSGEAMGAPRPLP